MRTQLALRPGQYGFDDGELKLGPMCAALVHGDGHANLVKGSKSAAGSDESVRLRVVRKRAALASRRYVHYPLDAVPRHENDDAILAYLDHVRVLLGRLGAEKDERVQCDRCTPGMLRERMPLIEVVNQLGRGARVEGFAWNRFPLDDGREEPVRHLVRVPVGKGGGRRGEHVHAELPRYWGARRTGGWAR